MLYTLNLHVTCQSNLNKAGGEQKGQPRDSVAWDMGWSVILARVPSLYEEGQRKKGVEVVAAERAGPLRRALCVPCYLCSGPTVTEGGDANASASSRREPPSQEQWHGKQKPSALEQARPSWPERCSATAAPRREGGTGSGWCGASQSHPGLFQMLWLRPSF